MENVVVEEKKDLNFIVTVPINTRFLRSVWKLPSLKRHADWQVLKTLPFGEMAWDYEEGIKIVGPLTVETLRQMASWVATSFEVAGVDKKKIDFAILRGRAHGKPDENGFSQFMSDEDGAEIFKQAGWQQGKYSWEWRWK